MELFISPQAVITLVYSEVIPLHNLGNVQISRASHVEPGATGDWWADLSPSRGPVLGPFPKRSLALQAEHEWLTQNVLRGHHTNKKESSQNHEIATPIERATNSIPSESQSIKAGLSGPDLS
jgi:hypothetical protein